MVTSTAHVSIEEFNDLSEAGVIRFYAEETDDGGVNLFDEDETPIILKFDGMLSLSLEFLAALAEKAKWIRDYINDFYSEGQTIVCPTPTVDSKDVKVTVKTLAQIEDRWGNVKDEGEYENDIYIPLPKSQCDFDEFLDSNLEYFREAKRDAENELQEDIDDQDYFQRWRNDASYWM